VQGRGKWEKTGDKKAFWDQETAIPLPEMGMMSLSLAFGISVRPRDKLCGVG